MNYLEQEKKIAEYLKSKEDSNRQIGIELLRGLGLDNLQVMAFAKKYNILRNFVEYDAFNMFLFKEMGFEFGGMQSEMGFEFGGMQSEMSDNCSVLPRYKVSLMCRCTNSIVQYEFSIGTHPMEILKSDKNVLEHFFKL